jgi:SAM-dependent methyltransferase
LKIKPIVKGALTFVPGLQGLLPKQIASNNPPTAYFYGVWLRHLAYLSQIGFQRAPECVAELGPGDSLGLGIAALLCGTERYYGMDVVEHTNLSRNVAVLDEIAELLRQRAPRPNKGWPNFDHLLDSRHFPSQILTDECLSASLAPQRIAGIRQLLTAQSRQPGAATLSYVVPWNDAAVIVKDSMDLIVSQSVLEHVTDIEKTYQAMYLWLKPGGVISHYIDLRSHNLARHWNGHRSIPEWAWNVMAGKRPYLLNREPWSAHRRAITDCGFEIVCEMQNRLPDGISRARLARKWADISDDDLSCAEVFVQARKPISVT